MSGEYEVEFFAIGSAEAPRFHAFDTMPEVRAFINRMIDAEKKHRAKPRDDKVPDSEMGKWFKLLSDRKPAVGYRYTITMVKRTVVEEKEEMF